MVSGFILVFNPFWVNFFLYIAFSFILLHIDVQFSQQNLLNRLSFPPCILAPLLKRRWAYVCKFISQLSVLFYLSICLLFFCQYHTVLITVAMSYVLKSETVIPPALFLLKIVLAVWGLLWFQRNFKVVFLFL